MVGFGVGFGVGRDWNSACSIFGMMAAGTAAGGCW